MKRIMILAEGQTEEAFINNVLAPYFWDKDIYLEATMICTKKTKGVRKHRGGLSSYDQVKRDINLLLKSTQFNLVTTFLDYYGLPNDFPGKNSVPAIGDCYGEVVHIEDAFGNDISHTTFKPFIMLHEFETMIFCDVYSLKNFFTDKSRNLDRLAEVANQFDTPEKINNSPQTAPSKRILRELEGYEKPLHGPLATKEIGINKIREICPHFNSWLEYLENF